MRDLVALEYRQEEWADTQALARRVGAVADRCVEAGVDAVGVVDLLAGPLDAGTDERSPALVFGVRAESAKAVVAIARQLAARGFASIYTWTQGADVDAIDPMVLIGHGMVRARGGHEVLRGCSPAKLRRQFDDRAGSWPSIWMPKPDRFDRAIDGVVIEEMGRGGVDAVWVPGSGVNALENVHETGSVPVIEARRDAGDDTPEMIAGWAAGDRLERSRARVADAVRRPRRWLRDIAGLQ